MRLLLVGGLLSLVAGCPAKRVDAPATVAGVGCPSAANVYVASYAQPPEGEQGHTGWVLPLHDVKVAAVPPGASYTNLDAAAARDAGVPQPPATIWLMPRSGPLCKATVGRYYAAVIEGAVPNIAYGVELSGCAAPADPSDADAIALVSDAPPSECRPLAPQPIATRLGEIDDKGQWSRPTKETPIPPAFAPVIPPNTCPDCETLWSVAEVAVDGKPVAWSAAVNWLSIPARAGPETQCTWAIKTFSGFFVAGPDGAPVKVSEGQEHPLALSVVLADRGGAKVLLAQGIGEYAAYDLATGAATLGRHLVWLIAEPAAYATVDRIGPECAP
jgi:hypothetical protein